MMRALVQPGVCLGLLVAVTAVASHPAAPPSDAAPPVAAPPVEAPPVVAPPEGTIEWLLGEVDRLTALNERLREQLAAARLRASSVEKELAELRQFITDHQQLGDDFAQYQHIKAITEESARRQAIQERRERHLAARAERRARLEEARARRDAENAEAQRLDRYREAGFAPIGLDVFTSRMAYSYKTIETNPVRIDYDPWLGLYYRPGGPDTRIDFGSMTISGSVLNASDQVRNIGIAITFFDEFGNQVGAETVQINNARPDVPYPFTSTLEMALDRVFASSSQYVLYADPVAAE